MARRNLWPTPTVNDAHNSTLPISQTNRDSIPGAMLRAGTLGGQLNPTWVELLMGWPTDWTCLDPMSRASFLAWGMGFNDGKDPRRIKAMLRLWCRHVASEIRQAIGRPLSLQEAKVLLAVLREHQDGSHQARVLMEGEKASQVGVRGVRARSEASGAPHRSKHHEQQCREHPNVVQALSRLLAHHGKEAWKNGSWENAVARVSTGVTSRADRLRCIGNGQVPGVVRLAWRTLTTTTTKESPCPPASNS
jgi:hypothetical protein